MSRKVVDIKTLTKILANRSATDLEEYVKRDLANGWVLSGPRRPWRYRNANYFIQSMVKYEDEEGFK
jgi:hypothetical protein